MWLRLTGEVDPRLRTVQIPCHYSSSSRWCAYKLALWRPNGGEVDAWPGAIDILISHRRCKYFTGPTDGYSIVRDR